MEEVKATSMIVGIFLVSILALSGCAQQTRYVCSDGTTVSDASLCPVNQQENAIFDVQVEPLTLEYVISKAGGFSNENKGSKTISVTNNNDYGIAISVFAPNYQNDKPGTEYSLSLPQYYFNDEYDALIAVAPRETRLFRIDVFVFSEEAGDPFDVPLGTYETTGRITIDTFGRESVEKNIKLVTLVVP